LEGAIPATILNHEITMLLDSAWLKAEALYRKIRKHVREPGPDRRSSLQRRLARRKQDRRGPKQAGCGLGVSRIDSRDVPVASLIDAFFQGGEKLCCRGHCWSPLLWQNASQRFVRSCNPDVELTGSLLHIKLC
jgi:hypothetical protein